MSSLPAVVRDRGSQENFDALNARTGALEKPKAWTAPSFQNSWEHYEAAGTYMPAAYRKSVDGRVTIRGLVKKLSAYNPSSIVFTLPAGFRPSKQLILPQWGSFSGGAAIGMARVDVSPAGEVLTFGNVTQADFLSLNLSFYAD